MHNERREVGEERLRDGVLTVNSFGAVSYDPDRRSEPASGVNSLRSKQEMSIFTTLPHQPINLPRQLVEDVGHGRLTRGGARVWRACHV